MEYINFFYTVVGFIVGIFFCYLLEIKDKSKKEKSEVDMEFVNIAIHQIRALLTNLSWIFDKLLGKGLGSYSEDQYEAISFGKRTSENAINLINDTLNAAIVGRSEPRFKFRLNDIANILENIVSEYSIVSRDRNMEIIFEKPRLPIPLFFFDSSQMYLALHDLIHNSIKYTKDGGMVKVGLELSGSDAKITVKDNGIGIPAGQIDKIFNKFFRADNAKKIEEKGSGLGLFIAKKIITRHSGSIELQSKENEGTTIMVTLPLLKMEPK